jgi:hypothetical protein
MFFEEASCCYERVVDDLVRNLDVRKGSGIDSRDSVWSVQKYDEVDGV